MAGQTTKVITASTFEAVRTRENGEKYLVLLITYDDATQARIVIPVDTVMPV